MVTRPRRGVLLLVVLALLAMFAMVAVAFVVLTRTEGITSLRLRTIDVVVDSAPKTLNEGFAVVVRGVPIDPTGVTTPTSAIKWCSLLEKIYGYETIGSLTLPAALSGMSASSLVCDGQLIEFTLPTIPPDATTSSVTSIDPFHYIGCVLTMLTGPNAGLSTRIVGINPQTLKLQMVAFDGGVLPSPNNNYLNGNQYIVNGFPYSGMGFGFDPKSGGLSQLSLLPNSPPSAWNPSNIDSNNKGIIPGGVHSDYSAADYQDPLLALAVPYNGGIRVAIPSLHRSDLIAYMGATNNVNLLRQVMFRPNSLDHPNFTGSNPNFNPVWDGITPGQGAWDVDNDGDGIPDSVWVDLGLPVRYTVDGRAYKPLFAILCLDMDGRLNLNAHSSYAQTQSAYYQQMTNPNQSMSIHPYQPLKSPPQSSANLDFGIGTTPLTQAFFAGPAGSSVTTAPIPVPRGPGTGPAEVSLLPLFRDPTTPGNFLWTNYQALLSGGTTGTGYMGRYGQPIGSALPGINSTGSVLTLNKAFPYSGILGANNNYWSNFQTIYDAHGSPPDHQTFGAVALDRTGRPVYISMGGPVVNGPYDLDLTLNAPHAVDQATVDNPFGVAEFERMLRPYDRDADTLPQRLASLTTLVTSNSGSFLEPRRAEFTTESWTVPVASGVLPPSLRANLNLNNPADMNRSLHPVDLLEAKILLSKGNTNNLNALRMQLLPWEVMQGLKMDLNRPFGSGTFSTQTNGSMIPGFARPTPPSPSIPDQPGTTGEQVKQYGAGGGSITAPVSYSADAGFVSEVNGAPVTNSLAARQLYARHLYVLTLALADSGALLTDLQKASPLAAAPTYEDVARLIAQWAVNVVAYRDHNGIMIPFPYDPYPFGNPSQGKKPGWNPDITTPAHTVWGCKRPELLITETLALHDRRTQDRNDEVVDKKKPGASPTRVNPGLTTDTDPKKHDPGFNSRYRPQGSLFLELYNPWTIAEPRTTDLGPAPAAGVNGVELTKKTPTVNGKSSPVWRLVVVVPTTVDPTLRQNVPPANGDELPDPDNPIVANRPTIERAAYFVNLTGMTTPGDGQVSYSPSGNNVKSVVVPPSGYAVVGSGDNNQQNRTFIGFENGKVAGNPSTTRMVTLNPGDLTPADPRVVRNTNAPPPTAAVPQVLAIDSPQRLSVSEPTKSYVFYEKDGKGIQAVYSAASGQYNETLDIPVDQQRELQPGVNPLADEGAIKIWTNYLSHNSTFAAYRIIYLQRLADPTRPFVSDVPGSSTYVANPQQWNPYRTIDAMTVDLTTFNGLSAPHSPIDPTSAAPVYHFESHQRGEKNYLPGNPPTAPNIVGEANLWKQEPADKSKVGWTNGGAPPKGTYYFSQPLNQTLGYLNQPYGQPSGNPAGDSQYPFPWLNWSYRPFNNEYELLLVPAVSSSRLLARNTIDPRRYYNYVDQKTRATIIAGPAPQDFYDVSTSGQVSYPHLLNFFESQQSSKAGLSAQLHRLFAYVGVPSRFANTRLQVRPDLAGQSGAGTAEHYFHTPFNWISRYREPGRINLNTVTSSDVLFGALNMYLPPLEQNSQLNPMFWDKFVRSRREVGFGKLSSNASQTLNNMLAIDSKSPSRFMRPFRTPGGAFLTVPGDEPARETDVTLLRSDPDLPSRPLFEVDDYLMGPTSSATGAKATPDQFTAAGGMDFASVDFNRNPYFRYQAMQKLGSVFSNHSNVFAVWITVGYFEVTPAAKPNLKDAHGSLVYPDGYQLGAELGSDTGDIVRHRAFYIFDRSIPVGFVRGKDINHQKAVLLNRFIE